MSEEKTHIKRKGMTARPVGLWAVLAKLPERPVMMMYDTSMMVP
jgi:hypothetical protein